MVPDEPSQRPDVVEETRALAQRYAAAADRRDRDAFASVFCEDGVLVTPRGELRGHAELRTVPDRLARYDQTRHTITGHELTSVDGDDATAATWCTAEHLTIGDVCIETYELRVRYDDRLRRDAGRWRIAERVVVVLAEEHRQG